MKLHQQTTPNLNTIRGFEPGSIQINNQSFTNSLIVMPDVLEENWPVEHPDQLSVEIISQLLAYPAEIILIGTGHKHHLLDPLLSLEATQKGTGIEIMTTEAACRTYNILLGEDRVVLAALIIEKNSGS
jgi:uncharacterized protein